MDAQTIANIEKHVGRLDLADHILAWDKKQAREVWDKKKRVMIPNPTARHCQHNPEHGHLQMHASGAQLMCCVTRPVPCDYAEPVSR
jgi:hypothetical protein